MRHHTTKLLLFPLVLLVVVLALATPGYAATYQLTDLQMEVTIPDDGIIFTRDMTEDDPTLAIVERSSQEIREYLESNNAYLMYFCGDISCLISIVSFPVAPEELLKNFVDCTEQELTEHAELCLSLTEDVSQQENAAAISQYVNYDLVEKNGIPYIILDAVGGESGPHKQYYTVCNAEHIFIGLFSYEATLTREMEDRLTEIIANLYITQEEEAMAPIDTAQQQELASGETQSDLPSESNTTAPVGKIKFLRWAICIFFCCLPIAIYRYVIRKESLPHRKALKITLLYALIIWLLVVFLFLDRSERNIISTLLVWSALNYWILISGKPAKEKQLSTPSAMDEEGRGDEGDSPDAHGDEGDIQEGYEDGDEGDIQEGYEDGDEGDSQEEYEYGDEGYGQEEYEYGDEGDSQEEYEYGDEGDSLEGYADGVAEGQRPDPPQA